MGPEQLHSYPPRVIGRFTPNSKAPKETSCTLTLSGFDQPVVVSIPLFSPEREVDTVKLKVSLFVTLKCDLLAYYCNSLSVGNIMFSESGLVSYYESNLYYHVCSK